ncbi:MAG: D-aminoacylase [Planctomycetaceae bacterium]|nr:D-aminoacylase [Planctomycetaceae bacterium]
MHHGLSRRRFLARSAAATAGWALPAAFGTFGNRCFASSEPLDLLISGGTIIDGTGAKRFHGDVAVRGGRIERVGELDDLPAKRRIDADGQIVCPGFIDIHTHSDRTLLSDGLAQSAVRQGATTHVIGNCGSSPAPLNQATTASGRTFRTYSEYLQTLIESGISVNVGGLVGHNTIREAVMGLQNRPPTAVEMRKMKEWVEEAMRGGAVGLSTGLVSPPGAWSTTEELIELARVAGKLGGIYASHMRGEAGTVIDSVREAIRIGREGKLPVEISHHKAAGKENWGKTRETLPLIEQANREGIAVRLDVYPYRAGSAGLSQLVPPWAHEGGNGEMLSRLEDSDTRRRIAREMQEGAQDWPNFFRIDWDDIQITSAATKDNQPWVGKKVGDVARARGCSGVDACIDLLIEERGSIGMINFIMDEDDVRRVLAHPLSMIGSDGFALAAPDRKGQPHPRCYGCFPRVLGRYCRELELFSLETAIHKMTGMPAAQLGWPDRGTIKVGAAADLVLFDAEKIIDKATFDEPHAYPEGIDKVIVNGQVVLNNGQHTGAKPGEILRPQRG